MTDQSDDNPNFLDHRHRRGDGVRRLNRVPLFIAGLMLLLILGAVTYTYQLRIAEMRRKAAEAETRPEPASISGLFEDAPDGGLIKAKQPPSFAAAPQLVPLIEKRAALPEDTDPYAEDWNRYRQERERLGQARNQRMLQAFTAPTRLQGPLGHRSHTPAQAENGNGDGRQTDQPQNASGQFGSLLRAETARQRRLVNGEAEEDLNRAAEKRAFLTDREPQSRTANSLTSGREAPLSPFEIKAGTVIPAIMVGGVNSDLPGQLIGQVAENVYDTATGRYILIPQGSKLVGTYDNAVTTGQSRVLVAWTRIIFPDASSLDLGKMPGADQSGFAGFKDKVDNHVWEMFSSALLMSVFSAGAQISQGGGNSGDNGQSAQQTIAAGLGQQLGQLGQELARRNARIQPTLEIRPGYRFTIMATKDMVLRRWRGSEAPSASLKKPW